MSAAPDDTHPAARDALTQRYAAMTPAEKLERVRALTLTAAGLALAGLRTRHPGESEAQLLRRLAGLRLGEDVATTVYGPSE